MILPPERLQIPFIVSSFGFIFTLIGLLAWSCSAAGGVGPLWNVQSTPLHGDFSWAMLFGVAGVLGECSSASMSLETSLNRHRFPQAPGVAVLSANPTGHVTPRSLTTLSSPRSSLHLSLSSSAVLLASLSHRKPFPSCATVASLTRKICSGASYVLDGQIIWQPFQLLPAIQEHYGNTSRVRAAVFFAGAGCTGAQLGIR